MYTGMSKSQIMYIEYKGDGIEGPARVGRVTFSKTGKSVYYGGRRFETLSGSGFKSNYFDVETREEYWISGCRKDGNDSLYGGTVEIDDDARREYWTEIRDLPGKVRQKSYSSPGKYSR